MMIYKGVIVNKTSSSYRLNFGGKLFKNGNTQCRYTKSETKKDLEERIPNHILHVQFERKISVSQSNLLYPLYVYNYLKRQKMPKRVKIFTSKWHGKQQHLFIHFLDHSNAFGLSRRIFFCREQAYQSLSYVRKGGMNFQLCPLLGPPGILTGPNWHMHNLAMGPTI